MAVLPFSHLYILYAFILAREGAGSVVLTIWYDMLTNEIS